MADARNGTTVYGYNNANQVTSVTTPAPAPGQPAQTTQTGYDNMGQTDQVTHPDGTVTTTEYHPSGLVKKIYGSLTYPVEHTYDPQGRRLTLKTWKDFNGQQGLATTTWTYDGYRGFLTNKLYPDGYSIAYSNSPTGRLLERKWSRGLKTTYAYTRPGELWTVTYDDGTTPGVTNHYDRRGRLVSAQQSGSGETVSYEYDTHGLRSRESHDAGPLAGLRVLWSHASNVGRRTQLDLSNAVSQVNLATTTYAYGSSGRMSEVSDLSQTATYAYHTDSSLVSDVAFTGGALAIQRAYDHLNRLTFATNTASVDGPLNYGYQYNRLNQRTNVAMPNGAAWRYRYDALGQVVSARQYGSGGPAVPGQQFEFAYDDIGNRKAAGTAQDAFGVLLQWNPYVADSANLYTQRTVPGQVEVIGEADSQATVTVNRQHTDRQGEYYWGRVRVANAAAPVWLALTNVAVINDGQNQDRAVTNIGHVFLPRSPESFAYDSDGNLMADGRWYYTWDGENRLVQVEYLGSAPAGSRRRLVFAYDGQGRRIRKTVTNVDTGAVTLDNKFLYDGWNLVAELNATNNAVIRSYTWGLDLSGSLQGAGGVGGLLMVSDPSTINNQPSTHFAAYDGRANVAGLVNAANGNITAMYEYGAFGELIRATGPMGRVNPFRFSTKYYDEETDLVAYPYRYYSPGLGRWLNRDYLEELGGLNLFGFVGNNPVRFVDPMGLDIYSSDSLFYPSGPLPYLTGDTKLESLAAGFFNGIPFVGNVAVLTKDAIVEAIQGLEDIVKWAVGEAGADRAVADLAGAAAGAATMLIGGPEARAAKLGCAAETVAKEQYFISSGVRRSLASQLHGVNQIPVTIVRSGQADVQTTLRLDQLFSPKFEAS